MPPRPLPIQLRVGTDICQITRIRKAVFREVPTEKEKEQRTYTRPVNLSHKARLELFMNKLFNHRERTRFWLHFPKFNVDDERGARRRRVVEYLSGRWAAKEAIIKAVAPRKLTFMDIEITTSGPDRKPFGIVLDRVGSPHKRGGTVYETREDPSGEALDLYDHTKVDGQIVEISISHDDDYATAVCIAPEMPELGDVGGEAAAREP